MDCSLRIDCKHSETSQRFCSGERARAPVYGEEGEKGMKSAIGTREIGRLERRASEIGDVERIEELGHGRV